LIVLDVYGYSALTQETAVYTATRLCAHSPVAFTRRERSCRKT